MYMNGYDCLTCRKYNFPSERLRLYDRNCYLKSRDFFAKLAHYSVYLDNDFACKNRSSKKNSLVLEGYIHRQRNGRTRLFLFLQVSK